MLRRQAHPPDFVGRASGKTVRHLGRRGKLMLWDLGDDLTLVVHLGMSGRIRVADPTEPREPHTNVVWGVGEREVRFVDPRTFGFVACLTPEELDATLAGIGPDALDAPPTVDDLAAGLRGRRPAVKTALLDQRVVAGLGNIYADEVLHRAGVDPRRPAGSLEPSELAAVVREIPAVLEDGLAHGGTSLDDLAYLLPDGRAGEFLGRLSVYGRTGQGCPRCATPIRRAVVAQRSTHWCPTCQR
jgi:formamidopyrimidine-DNA glycosylase